MESVCKYFLCDLGGRLQSAHLFFVFLFKVSSNFFNGDWGPRAAENREKENQRQHLAPSSGQLLMRDVDALCYQEEWPRSARNWR